ncbi:tyrosine-type recombinase/integrase [Ruegeria sp. HKCCE4150]|uniref:tyrosine-type recombinase/integrase n=1 Tax=Ruegeria sp. HKCCE4150 TaxID=2794828 RepID=UPI001AE9DABA|nr:site-specific integrase [Ruegeria sp. HKCCE4150]
MAKRLTARSIESLGPGRYSDGTGIGLMLWVSDTGARSWVQRLRVHGRRRDMGLGSYPLVTLAEARDLAQANKKAAVQGRDPFSEKRRLKKEAARRLTFAEAAERTRDELAPTWRGKKEPQAFLSSLKTYAFPYFGNTAVVEITSADIRRAVLACRAKVPNLSVKVQHRILSVFRWSIAEGLRETNPATSEALALPKMERKQKNNRALPYSEVRDAIETIKASGAWASTKLAIEFTVLTAARSGEVRGAVWDEIDMSFAVWTIPAERMKMNREHRVPLSGRALEVLKEAESLRDASGLVFPSVRGKQLSDMTLSKLVKELGIKSTVHGFRSSFRTWAQERTNVPGEVAEAALAHVKADKVEAAYARSDLFEKRRKLMKSWAAFLSEDSAKVARIG